MCYGARSFTSPSQSQLIIKATANPTLYLWQPQAFKLCEQRNTLVFSSQN